MDDSTSKATKLIQKEKIMWPRSDLTDLLQIEHPIVQAPMAGEATTAMAVAVCNAGGLGGIGCSFMTDDEIRTSVEEIRAATDKPFNLNFFSHAEPREDPEVLERARDLVTPFYEELGIKHVPTQFELECETFNESRMELLLEIQPKVISFHVGVPPAEMIKALQDIGSVIFCSATTVAEARQLVEAGVDVVVAQGSEAGGNRGSLNDSRDDFAIGTLALVPQIADAVDVPVVAAGGIAEGRGIAATFALGASGVQLGTAFLSCPEANVSHAYRRALKTATDDGTRITRAFSGHPSRVMNNRYTDAMAQVQNQLPDYPIMSGLSGPLQKTCLEQGGHGFECFIWGQAAAMNRELPAGTLVRQLVEEAQGVFASIGGEQTHTVRTEIS